eukprot:4862119-Ditylum_brightwellii.AAC.2
MALAAQSSHKKSPKIFWDKGSWNDVNYFTKYHPPAHHRIKRECYILKGFNLLCNPTYVAAYIQK